MSRCIYCKREAGLFRKLHPECKHQHFGSAEEVELLNPGDEQGHEAILKQGVEVWNDWRRRNPELRPDLRRVVFVHAKLSGVDLSRADLEEAQLRGADLRDADIEGARLHKANLKRARLTGAYLEQADLSEADLSESDLRNAHVSVANLHDAKLVKARLSGASLVGSTLRNADLSEADLEDCKIRGADARGACFFQAVLRGAHLQQSDLSGARLSEADLEKADLSGTQLASSDLVKAKMQGADIRWSNLNRANLSQAELGGADCRNAHFSHANLKRARLQGADLSDAFLIESNLDHALLEGCRIPRLMVRGVAEPAQPRGGLILSHPGEPSVQVASLEAAQFIQMLVEHSGMRCLLDSPRSRLVPVIGCFSANGERAEVGRLLQQAVEQRGLTPVLVDCLPHSEPTLPELVLAIAEVASCIVVDWSRADGLSNAIEPLLSRSPSVPVQPLLQQQDQAGNGLSPQTAGSGWLLELIRYENASELSQAILSASWEAAP